MIKKLYFVSFFNNDEHYNVHPENHPVGAINIIPSLAIKSKLVFATIFIGSIGRRRIRYHYTMEIMQFSRVKFILNIFQDLNLS